MFQEDTLKELESFVGKLYGYNKLSSMNKVQKCIFTSKYDKEKKLLDLCILPPCQENSANMLQMDLEPPLEHIWMRILQLCGVI